MANPCRTTADNTATKFKLRAAFPGGTELIIRNDTDNGALIEGEKGRIFVNRRRLTGGPVEALIHDDPLPEDAIQKAYKGLPIEETGAARPMANFLYASANERIPCPTFIFT